MNLSRRRFLGLLGLAPAIPLINQLPVPAPALLATGGVVRSKTMLMVGDLVAHGGWCAPLSPTYNLMNISAVNRPVWKSLPPIKAARGAVRYVAQAGSTK